MPDDIATKRHEQKVLEVARELRALGVDVLGFLKQARDGERRARFLRKLFEVESIGVAHPPTYEQRRFRHVADELRGDLEKSRVLFAPSVLWELRNLRLLLWNGGESKETTAGARKALQLVGEALADRRSGTHGRPLPGGRLRQQREDAQLVTLLSQLARGAVDELKRAKVKTEDTVDSYVRALRRIKFWEDVDQAYSYDPKAPNTRASRLAATKERLESELFFPTREHPERQDLRAVVAAMATALLGGETDPAIFGGSGETDGRVTARSLALRALRQLHFENLEISKR